MNPVTSTSASAVGQTGASLAPLIMHMLYRFDIGGLENGVVNLINRMPASRYRHAVVALTEVNPGFARRIQRDDVQFISLHKPPGQGFRLYPAMFRLFRQLRPAILHTRNFAALEAAVPAWAAGVPVRVHGEHGRDVNDLDGTRRRYQVMRRVYSPFVHRYVTVSQDLAGYLVKPVGIAADRIQQIYNGVDAMRFHPPASGREPIPGCPFTDPELLLVGTVGRMQAVKDQLNLVRAFIAALQARPGLRGRLRLVMAGDGPLRAQAAAELAAAGLAELAWLPGDRDDVALWMRGMDCFVLPSLAEGISNTILEAMSSGLPVIATAVGGNVELVQDGVTGWLVPAGQPQALADRLVQMAEDTALRHRMGRAARAETERRFALPVMVDAYMSMYDELMSSRGVPTLQARS